MKDIIATFEKRFLSYPHRHPGVDFDVVKELLDDNLLHAIEKMEETGGEPDVIIYDGTFFVVDFYKESPAMRVNVCYDLQARLKRKRLPPHTSAVEQCQRLGTKLVDEAMYRHMQSVEDIDLKTSCWIDTPIDIRHLGGALFGDKRYNHTFVYHNSADSYYSVRGYRSFIKLDQ